VCYNIVIVNQREFSDMPIKDGQGYSDNTPQKQEFLETIVSTHLNIVQRIIPKYSSNYNFYQWIDLNSGCGINPNCIGSPFVFLNAVRNRKMAWIAHFIDINNHLCKELYQNIFINYLDIIGQCITHNGDNAVIGKQIIQDIPSCGKQVYGMIYSDENGEVNFDALAEISKLNNAHKIDFLIHIGATALKRVNGVYKNRYKLTDGMKLIKKKHWLVREPYGKNQWTFLLGTNWDSFPEFKSRGFFNSNSKEGIEILTRLNYTQSELNSGLTLQENE